MSPPDYVHVCRGVCVHLDAKDVRLLSLVAEGASNEDIAKAMDLAESTVKNRLTKLYFLLGVRSRVELTLVMVQWGVLELEAAVRKRPNQRGSVYYHKHSRRWVAAVTAGLPKKIMVYCFSKGEAEKALAELLKQNGLTPAPTL